MNRAELIRRGNIITTQYAGGSAVGRYLGNGRFGAIMSETGLNLSPAQEDLKKNKSWFNHMTHWGRFRFFSQHVQKDTSADYILPLFRIFWEEEWTGFSGYSQIHDLYDGVLTTQFAAGQAEKVQVTNWFDAEHKDAAGVIIDISAGEGFEKRIRFAALEKIIPFEYACSDERVQSVQIEAVEGGWRMTVACGDTVNDSRTEVYIRSDMEARVCGTELSLAAKPGRNRLMPMPKAAAAQPTARLKIMDCRSTPRASSCRSAPRYCAT